MDLTEFAPSWREFHRRQMNQARVLVVDDEPNVGRFLIHALKQSGYSVSVAHSVEQAWSRIREEDFDLLLVDRTMPKQGGILLLERLQASTYEVPAVLMIGDVSPSSISEALHHGAADYLSKPFVNMEHLVRRIESVLDKRLTTLFYDVMLGDLSKAILAGTGQSKKFTTLSRSLLQLKEKIGGRPACVLVDDDGARRDARLESIRNQGIIAIATPPEGLDGLFAAPDAPLVAVFSLESDASQTTMAQLANAHPKLLILALAHTTSIRNALRAVENGALDYAMLLDEGIDICGTRIKRLVDQARRQELYSKIATLMDGAARETRPDLAEDVIFREPAT